MKNKKDAGLSAVIGAGCTWFGAEMGAGTASGANSMNYFVKPGWIGLWLCLFFTIAEGWYSWWALEFARLRKISDYGSFLHAVWHPLDHYIVPFLDLFVLITTPIFLSGCISGTATLISQYFSVSYHLSVLIVTVSYFLMEECGYVLLKRIGTLLTLVIVVLILAMIAACFPSVWPRLLSIQRSCVMGEGYTYASALFLGMAAWGQQSSCINMCVSTSEELKTRKDTLWAVMICIVLITILKTMLTAVLMGRWPANLNAPIYILDAVQASDQSWLNILYPILLAACFITTGPLNIYTARKRLVNYRFWQYVNNESLLYRKKNQICAGLFTAAGFILANFSFNFITGVIQYMQVMDGSFFMRCRSV